MYVDMRYRLSCCTSILYGNGQSIWLVHAFNGTRNQLGGLEQIGGFFLGQIVESLPLLRAVTGTTRLLITKTSRGYDVRVRPGTTGLRLTRPNECLDA